MFFSLMFLLAVLNRFNVGLYTITGGGLVAGLPSAPLTKIIGINCQLVSGLTLGLASPHYRFL